MARLILVAFLAGAVLWQQGPAGDSLLDNHLLITWYGNPRTARMGVLGRESGEARALALEAQARQYAKHTARRISMAYHLVAVVAQCTPGVDNLWRRRETADVIGNLLEEARAHGFRLVLDIQPGRSTVVAEVDALTRWLAEPDVDLALDPEFSMGECEQPGREIGSLTAADVNAALDRLERIIEDRELPSKVLIVHQFRLDMLPDKSRIRKSRSVSLVLNMDGFGSQSLKLSSYQAVMRQPLPFAGIKLFYQQDVGLFTPAQVMSLKPVPSVVIYQ
jgi:hypothetical protein